MPSYQRETFNPEMVLSIRQRLVLDTIRMNMKTNDALEYLKAYGYEIGVKTYWKDKKKIDQSTLKRIYHIAKAGFQQQHIERIDHIEVALKEMWARYIDEKDNFRKVLILEKIIMVQPYLSSYYEATKKIIEENPTLRKNLDNIRYELDNINSEQLNNNSQFLALKDKLKNISDDINNTKDGSKYPEHEQENPDISTNGNENPNTDQFDKVTERFNKEKRDFIL